jgi:4-hydroxy-tetrahydrodipicolinate synthase
LKDSSGDWSATKTYISALKHTGFKVYCGSETFLLQTLREGGTGCISATANINGPAIARLASTCGAIFSPSLPPFFLLLSSHISSWTSLSQEKADAEQQKLDAVRNVISRHNMIAGELCRKLQEYVT